MKKGRPPLLTIRDAERIARTRGAVITIPGKRSDAFDLIICEGHRVVFVRVRRTLTQFTSPPDVAHQYRYDVARCCRLPLTEVTAREFWLRLPGGTWQFFLILHTGIVEIAADGRYSPRTGLPVETKEFRREENRE